MKYTQALENGDKHYVVEVTDWGRHSSKIVVAANVSEARYAAVGRTRPGVTTGRVRRATPEDLKQSDR